MKKVKFASKNKNTKRGKSLKAVPFVMTYHPKLKSMKKVIHKYLDRLSMDNEVKRVFTPKHMIPFRNARKLSTYLERTKLYPTERIVGSYKCGGKRCINVNETSTFTSTVTGETYIISHRFDCNERCLVYLLTCNKCKCSMLGRLLLTSFGQDGTITKVIPESMVRELHVCSNICLTIFVPLVIAVS